MSKQFNWVKIITEAYAKGEISKEKYENDLKIAQIKDGDKQ